MAVFLFRRDLRLIDNTALHLALSQNKQVLPIFIFPPEQIDPKKNRYFSNPAVQFMCESLQDLDGQLKERKGKLHLFYGENVATLEKLYQKFSFTKLYFNKDYSEYAKKRDHEIETWCRSKGIETISIEDYGLIGIDEGLVPKDPPHPYYVLSQFYARFFKDLEVRKPETKLPDVATFVKKRFTFEFKIQNLPQLYEKNERLAQIGGRKEGMRILERLIDHKPYGKTRDFPALHGTSRASAHLRFGTISIREMYWRIADLFGKKHPLIRELVFRDFYLKIYTFHPELQRGTAFRKELDEKIKWNNDPKYWKAWTTGNTGYPLVDAGIRQLLATGWMHNRVRMTVASVATRYFYLDWRKCAQWFYQHLVDADPYSNTAGWQWAAGIGVDSAPYFRPPFNPFRQSKRFDAQAEYIYQWLPELSYVDSADLHKWDDPKIRAKYTDTRYPSPLPRK